MTDVLQTFGTLEDVPVRLAWKHEALGLTPWLAANLGRLGSVLGMQVELEGTERAVENFAADILARDVLGNRLVLIENQLEQSDHKHLGQIMTYLAGLESQVMIWVATDFAEAHQSAIRWLNEHTVDPFAFFAVRLRVVRIADSPLAPLFEIVEQPNNWERQIQRQVRDATELSDVGKKRRAFWEHLVARHPEEGSGYPPDAASTRLRTLPTGVAVVQYLAKASVGVFVRAPRGGDASAFADLIQSHRAELEQALGAVMGSGGDGYYFTSRISLDTDDRATWDRAADWLVAEARRYTEVTTTALGRQASA